MTSKTPEDHRDCPACLESRSLDLGSVGGYVRGPQYRVRQCLGCGSQTVIPAVIPAGLYDAIYANAGRIDGGYARYLRYADEIDGQSDPLGWLASQEDMYWGVRQAFTGLEVRPGANVVEIGCGLGYLTYAMHRAGYEALGIDLSSRAIENATTRFGNLYAAGDAIAFPRIAHADVLIAMELIEHLPDPRSFLQRLRHAMRPDAKVILSTPCRDTYPPQAVWNTDLPPVHLHWFTESGLAALSRSCGFDISFVDFSRRNEAGVHRRWIAGSAYRSPRFDEALEPVPYSSSAPPRLTPRRVLASVIRRASTLLSPSTPDDNILHGRRSVTMVAILTHTP